MTFEAKHKGNKRGISSCFAKASAESGKQDMYCELVRLGPFHREGVCGAAVQIAISEPANNSSLERVNLAFRHDLILDMRHKNFPENDGVSERAAPEF